MTVSIADLEALLTEMQRNARLPDERVDLPWSSDPDDRCAAAAMTYAVVHRSHLVRPLLHAGVNPNVYRQDLMPTAARTNLGPTGIAWDWLPPSPSGVIASAVWYSTPDALRALFEAGADWNRREPLQGGPDALAQLINIRCPVWLAEDEFWQHQDGRMTVLEQHGFVPQASTLAMALPRIVVQRSTSALIPRFRAWGADPNGVHEDAIVQEGRLRAGTALHLAMDRPTTVGYAFDLIEAGAHPGARDADGLTVLARLEKRLSPLRANQVQIQESAVWQLLQEQTLQAQLQDTAPSTEARPRPRL